MLDASTKGFCNAEALTIVILQVRRARNPVATYAWQVEGGKANLPVWGEASLPGQECYLCSREGRLGPLQPEQSPG